jgi:hypothetical protein
MTMTHWTPQRKIALLLAIDYELLSPAEALERFTLSSEELASWRRLLTKAGLPAMRSTRLQFFPEAR